MTTTTESEPTAPVELPRLVTYGIIAVILASVVNAFIRVVATTLLGVPADFGPLGWGPVVNTTIVGVVGASGVYGLLTRLSKRPNRTFLGIAAVGLVLSFVPLLVPPAFLAAAPASVLWTLAVMHVTTATVVVGLLPRTRAPGGLSR